MVSAGICPALDSSLPWLDLRGADSGAGSARDGGGAEGGGSDERHYGAVERPIDSGEEQWMVEQATKSMLDGMARSEVIRIRIRTRGGHVTGPSSSHRSRAANIDNAVIARWPLRETRTEG